MEKQEIFGCIYIHKNKVNGKVYVGQTIQNPPSKRWGRNGIKYQGQSYFWKAIQKYGWDNFEHTILEDNIPEKKLSEREEYWIKFYNAANREYGYNYYETSNLEKHTYKMPEKWNGEARKQYYEEHPEKVEQIRQKVTELWQDPAFRDKALSNRPDISGENNPMYGKHLSEETKQKISEHFKNRAIYRDNTQPVKNLDTGEIFYSTADAAESLGKDRKSGSGNIKRAASGQQNKAYGYSWAFIDKEQIENFPENGVQLDRKTQGYKLSYENIDMICMTDKRSRNGKPVKNLDTNLIYENCGTAAEKLTGDRKKGNLVSCAASGRQKTALGYHWAYLENLPEYN